jgi:hypothetical protein
VAGPAGAAAEWARGGKAGCGGASVEGETWERGRLDRRKLVRPRILGCVVVSDSMPGRGRGRAITAATTAAASSATEAFLSDWLTDDEKASRAGQQR